MPSSVARLAALDHERLLRLLRRAVTPGPSQRRWRDEVVQLASAHRAAEREVLTTAVLEPAGPAVRVKAEHVVGPGREHDELDRLVEELAAPTVPPDRVAELGDRLRERIAEHAQLTDEVLGQLERSVPRKEIRRLGGVYEASRDSYVHGLGGDEPLPRRFDVSRAELYELARRAGVVGRSSMSRRDLIAELQRHQGAG